MLFNNAGSMSEAGGKYRKYLAGAEVLRITCTHTNRMPITQCGSVIVKHGAWSPVGGCEALF